jgi:arylsulfatase A-like enzyme
MNVDRITLVELLLLIAALLAVLVVDDRRHSAPGARTHSRHTPGSRLRGFGNVLTVAIWFGLLTGLLHLALAFVDRFVRHRLLMVGPQILWFAPIAYTLFFAALAAVVGAALFLLPRPPSMRAAFAVFAWLSVFALLLPFPQMGPVASAIVAAGVAVQVSRVMARRSTVWVTIMRKSVLIGAGAIAAASGGYAGWQAAAEHRAVALLPEARPHAPNVLLIVMDTVRAANVSLNGYERPTTPELERWARDGVTFDHAFSTGPWTLKSHASMFTGLYPSQVDGDFARPVTTDAPMLAEIFRDRGYATGGFVANLAYASHESGLARGFVHYDDYRAEPRQAIMHAWIAHTPLFRDVARGRSTRDLLRAVRQASLTVRPGNFNDRTYTRRSAGEINAAFLDWQSTHTGRPFFAFLNYFDGHFAYRPAPEFEKTFALPSQPDLGHYDGAIATIDREIGRLFDVLQARGLLDNTIAIVTSDHGEQFGEHGLNLHANSLYIQLLHVPMMIRFPARAAGGARVDMPVTLRDLPATILDLAGFAEQTPVPGFSLAPLWDPATGAARRSPIIAEGEPMIRPEPDWPIFHGPMRSILDDEFHYIRRGDGFEELYAYRVDPLEVNNLASTPAGLRAMAWLRSRLSEALAEDSQHR